MKQCLIIQGGDCFDTQELWYASLAAMEVDPNKPWFPKRRDRLKTGIAHAYEVRIPQMPVSMHATYRARKIRFEKHLPYLNEEEMTLIGYSLGGWFLCKRLSENTFPKQIAQLHLVAGLIERIDERGSADFGFDHSLLAHVAEQCDEIFIYHSRDDTICPYTQAELIHSHLPKAELITFETRGHFFQPAFPELLEKMRVYVK
jgi:predicted alpha/beta hydrolase family esterase